MSDEFKCGWKLVIKISINFKMTKVCIGSFEFTNFIGRGSYGACYLAKNKKNGEMVCVKLENKKEETM